MRSVSLSLIILVAFFNSRAGIVRGTVTDTKGTILPFASVFIKETTIGVTANNLGKYELDLEPGDYTLVCQYVGYARQEKKIKVGPGQAGAVVADFHLSIQQLSMKEFVVRPGGEDPAYAIIRHAIKKRKDYQSPLDSFTCEAYIKTTVQLRKLPEKIFGQKIDSSDKKEMGLDSTGKGILFLSESFTKVSFKKPEKLKLEVISGRESGSNGYGFDFPTFINFYNNNVVVFGPALNARGFVSPIADGALNYYRYKYLGSFFEDGKEVNKIKVIPRRKYEPLFSGIINITEDDWRIHSLDLILVKTAQLEILDTLHINQIMVPVAKNVWQTKNQTIFMTLKLFGVDVAGNVLDVYNKYDIKPKFPKNYFNRTVIKYDTAINKKTTRYWDSLRPVQLEPAEVKDYAVKDSIFHYNRDSSQTKHYRDSLQRREGKITYNNLYLTGITYKHYGPKRVTVYRIEPPLSGDYNTVEGWALKEGASVSTPVFKNKELLSVGSNFRYGFNNRHFNSWASVGLSRNNSPNQDNPYGLAYEHRSFELSGGKRIEQFNNDNPISPAVNAFYTLFFKENYEKIYENYFGQAEYSNRMENGLDLRVNALFEDRLPLNNTTDYSYFSYKYRKFTANYPVERIDSQFTRHRAFLTGVDLQYQPGQRFIEFPNHKVSIGSKYPILEFFYQHGWKNVFNSITDFDKWSFSVSDNLNLKLKGLLRYRLTIGGFITARDVPIQDYQHFNGNQTFFESQYLNSFQLAPYYANSTTASLYSTGHLEYHLNGFLTNKIPLFRRLSWWLEGGSNVFYVNANNNYVEVFGGLENVFKIFRVDFVASYLDGQKGQVGFRLGFGGLLQGTVQRR